MRAALAALLAASLLAAGCANPPAPATAAEPTNPPESMDIAGTVQGPGLRPIAGALVSIVAEGRTVRTGADGGFRFDGLSVALHLVEAEADGYLPDFATVDPAAAAEPVVFVLSPRPETLPFNETQHFQGIIQCAVEVLIIPGSCDALLAFAGQAPVFQEDAAWDYAVRPGWRTMVIDVVFDPDAQPGLEGLRLVLRGPGDGEQLNDYEQYGRFQGTAPFTARVEPNGTYEDGVAPVPANGTLFNVVVYPQGHGWHQACDPATGTCFLGVGAGIDVAFDLFVTTFYNAAAPEGFTLRGA